MNLILLFQDDFIDNTSLARLQGRRLKHVLDVHRASIGDELCVGVLNGQIGTGKITSLTQSDLKLEVRLERAPPAELPLTLLLALPRPKVVRRILRSVSSLGVKRIILLNCSRVEKSFWRSPFLNESTVKEQLVLGLEQARDTVLPEVLLRPLFKPFIEDELPNIITGTLPLVAHPHAAEPCPRDTKRAVTLAIGPEGGFIPYELERLSACGFTPVQMGERTLSVETAVPALIARLF
jgi:16S rRNA (uracil1498-N3)-methyltransferase